MPATALPEGSIAALAFAFRRITRRFLPALGLVVALLALVLLVTNPERIWPFLASAGPALLIMALSAQAMPASLPIFPLYIVLQALSFCSPLFASQVVADWRVAITPELLGRSALPLLLWFTALWLGWRLTPTGMGKRPTAPPLTQALGASGTLPHWCLATAFSLQLLLSSSAFWQLPGSLSQGLLNPIQVVISLASITGSFIGAFAWARGRLSHRWLWLFLLMAPVVQSLTSLLLSSIQSIVLAALLGLWLGRARQALAITLVGLLLLAFLHQGKAVIRGIYWNEGAAGPINPIVLLQQWAAASVAASDEDPQVNLFTARFNNLQNLLYVEQELASGTPTLAGESLAVIPQVLLPRLLNTEKVRSQEGQVLLNLHFGRQNSREATETAYIAWGFLAEGVGNFGSVAGPLIMGVATGSLLRITENLGRGQWILSTPGLLSLTLMVFWLSSYEMAASTFVAAALQLIVVVMVVGWWLGRPRTRQRPLPG